VENNMNFEIWTFSPGEVASTWDEFKKAGIMAIGWDEIGDLRKYKSREEIKKALLSHYGPDSDVGSNITNEVNVLWQFCHDLRIGDTVYVKNGTKTLLGMGTVCSEYGYNENAEEHRHYRRVNWQKTGEWKIISGIFTIKSLTKITAAKSFCKILEDTMKVAEKAGQETDLLNLSEDITPASVEEHSALEGTEAPVRICTQKDFLRKTFLNLEDHQVLTRLLLQKKTLILQGPPGVGKSFIAPELAYSIMGERDPQRVLHVQLYPGYDFDRFVFNLHRESPQISLTEGPFYSFCRKAEQSPDSAFFLILDELNHCDLNLLLENLLPLLHWKRRGEVVQFENGKIRLTIPGNIYVIGLLNTVSRDLFGLEQGIRCLFPFFSIEPAYGRPQFEHYLSSHGIEERLVHQINTRMMELNDKIESDPHLGKGYRIGHSYFCDCELMGEHWYQDIIRYEIGPLLYAYWQNEPSAAERMIDLLMR